MQKKQKKQKDMGKIATKVMAIILAALMLLSTVATLIFYFISMAQS